MSCLTDVLVSAGGYNDSTKVTSLLEAFKTLNLELTLPSLKTSLLENAALTGAWLIMLGDTIADIRVMVVLPTTGRVNNISHVAVTLANPFSTPLRISRIQSTVSTHGIALGTIDSSTAFTSEPNGTTKSPALDLNMNFDPNALFTVTRVLAQQAGLEIAPLDGIVQIGGYHYLSTADSPQPQRRNLFTYVSLDVLCHDDTHFEQRFRPADICSGSFQAASL